MRLLWRVGHLPFLFGVQVLGCFKEVVGALAQAASQEEEEEESARLQQVSVRRAILADKEEGEQVFFRCGNCPRARWG